MALSFLRAMTESVKNASLRDALRRGNLRFNFVLILPYRYDDLYLPNTQNLIPNTIDCI